MKNKEILIKILLMLRSNGINNSEILFSVEKLPPHYYENLLGFYYNSRQNYFDELELEKYHYKILALIQIPFKLI